MYTNILIATDGSELGTRGLTHGLELAEALNLPVTIVTTTETWSAFDITQEMKLLIPDPVEQFEKMADDASNKILESAEKAATELGVSCECVHIRDQHPAEGILEAANSNGCSLIVIASHGRRGVQKILLGSVASQVLANSNIPVLIIK